MHGTTTLPLRVGIIGGAGYTGGELLRILLHHPHAHISFVHSVSNAGKPVATVHHDLIGDTGLVFSDIVPFTEADVLFLCLGHGESSAFLSAHNLPPTVRVIDLSQDFRYAAPVVAENVHWLYGLPELNREQIASAHMGEKTIHIANPGCFATCIQLGLLPLASKGLLPQEIHITGITGSTGAGQSLVASSHFSWRAGNVSVYKAFQHQHVREIQESLRACSPQGENNAIQSPPMLRFVPMRGSFTRGILASMYCTFHGTLEAAQSLYAEYYASHPFVQCVKTNPDVKQVVNTNKCLVYLEKHDNILFIVSVLDNLLKGASGQAVQNMNLLFGIEETSGLRLKASAF